MEGKSQQPIPDVRKTISLLVLLGSLLSLILLGTMMYAVLSLPGETTFVGRRGGPWRPVPTWQVQVCSLALLLPLMALVFQRAAVALGRLARALLARTRLRETATGLALGEPIFWQGGQGWRGVPAARILWIAAGAIGLVGFLTLTWHIWTGTNPLPMKLFWTAIVLLIFSGSLAMALTTGAMALQRCWLELFGTMVVTDRRIAWLSPLRGRVYHEVRGDELIEAALVGGDERRGWIAIVQQANKDVRTMDVRGVPRPFDALAALSRLVPPPGQAPAPAIPPPAGS